VLGFMLHGFRFLDVVAGGSTVQWPGPLTKAVMPLTALPCPQLQDLLRRLQQTGGGALV